PSTYGQTVAFSIQVTAAPPGGSPGTAIPTGTVTLTDGATVLGTVTLDSAAKATLIIGTLVPGSHNITATYGGDANFSKGSSIPYAQTINKAATQTSLTSSVNPTTNASIISINVTVTSAAGIPSGAVTLRDGAQPVSSAQLDNSGNAVFTLSNLAAGSHGFAVAYGGD